MSLYAAMPTCAARREVRAKVLQSLALHGVHPELFACNDDDKTPRQRFIQNIKEIGRSFDCASEDYLLVVEDDILVGPSFKKMLQRAMLGEYRLVSFFNPNRNGYTKEALRCIDTGARLAPSFYGATNQKAWFGGLALLFSRDCFERLWPAIWAADDLALDTALQTAEDRLFCCIPNPIDHRDIPSATSARHWGGRIRSISYHGETA